MFSGLHHVSGLKATTWKSTCVARLKCILHSNWQWTQLWSPKSYMHPTKIIIFLNFLYMYLHNLIICQKLICNYYSYWYIETWMTTAHIQVLKDACNYKIWGFMVAKYMTLCSLVAFVVQAIRISCIYMPYLHINICIYVSVWTHNLILSHLTFSHL